MILFTVMDPSPEWKTMDQDPMASSETGHI